MDGTPSCQSMKLEETLYLFHHVFLPPKVPQAEDYNAEFEHLLLGSVVNALQDFIDYIPVAHDMILRKATEMIARLRKIHGSRGEIDKSQLMESLKELPNQGGILPTHVREQNAAILLRWQNDEMISIESFELSARNEAVMTTVGRLRRTFPGPTMVMHRANFEEPGLQELMAQTISTMSHQPVAGTKPKVKKAGQEHDEDRDTTHPKMVTEFLMSTLRPRCTDISTAQIQKNTREEVMWLDCRSPWRRSALWFLVRVILQLTYYRSSLETNVGNLYKQFIIFFMGTIVDKASTELSSEELFLMNAKIARRLLKLDLAEEPAWFASVQETLSRTNSAIQGHWSHLKSRNSHIVDKGQICGLDFRRDTQCPLPGLDLFLGNKGNPKKKHQGKEYFQPQPNLISYPQTELPEVLDSNDSDYNVYNLAAFENWVASDLNTWLDVHQGEEETCGQLGTLMARYFEKASSSYLNDPEATSNINDASHAPGAMDCL